MGILVRGVLEVEKAPEKGKHTQLRNNFALSSSSCVECQLPFGAAAAPW